MKPEVVYRGRQFRSSLQWLALALFLGGSPLVVYFTMPDPKPATLALAVILGVPLFWLSLHDLGKSTGLILNPGTRQLKYVEGLFSRREVRVHAYEDVREVRLVHRYHPTSKGAAGAEWCVQIAVAQGECIVLVEGDHRKAARLARTLEATILGVPPRMDGEPPTSAPPEPSRDGIARATRPPAPTPRRKA
jgi:hypothetical protein